MTVQEINEVQMYVQTVQEIEELIQKLINYRDLLLLQEKLGQEVNLSDVITKMENEVQMYVQNVGALSAYKSE